MSDEPANGLWFDFKIDGEQIGSFTAVEGLTASYEIRTYEEGGENGYVHQLPGRLKYENLKLTRPVDQTSKNLAAWFSSLGRGQELRRRTATVIAYDSNKKTVAQWSLSDVYPVRYTGPSLSAENPKILTESLEFAHSGFLS